MISERSKQKLKGSMISKTQWLALAVLISGYLQMPAHRELIVKAIGETWFAVLIMVFGLGIMVARWYTESSLADKVNSSEDGEDSEENPPNENRPGT